MKQREKFLDPTKKANFVLKALRCSKDIGTIQKYHLFRPIIEINMIFNLFLKRPWQI